jgi:choline dehydrogenase
MRLRPASYKPGLIRKLDDKPGITGVPWQMRPLSLLARTPDPHDQPAINPRYLAEDTDRRAMVGGFKFLRRLFAAPAMAKYVVAESCRAPVSRATTSCWIMPGRTARRSTTPAAAA